MSVHWCARPVYHSGKTKVDPKPSQPRRNRKADDELARFINDKDRISFDSTAESIREGDLLCQTCYEKESTRLNLHSASLTKTTMYKKLGFHGIIR